MYTYIYIYMYIYICIHLYIYILSDLSHKARLRRDLSITLGPSSMTSRASPRYFAWYNMTHCEGS